MFDPERLLGEMLGGALGGAFGGKRGRRKSGFRTGDMAGKAQLGVGLIGIAIAAYEHYSARSDQPAAPAPVAAPPPPPPAPVIARPPPPPPGMPAPPPAAVQAPVQPSATEQRRHDMVLMVQAMIAAAAADGRIDDTERGHILERAADAGLDADSRAFLERELDAPQKLAAIVERARPELAADLYAASLIAIDPDTDAERLYLDRLASALALDAKTRQTIHEQLGLT